MILKRVIGTPQPKSGAKKKKLPTISQLKVKVWNECKRITREKYGNVCYTSGQPNLEGSNWHTGHGLPKGSLSLKYQFDLRNLRPQSYNENINKGGNSHVFLAKLERDEEGLSFLKEVAYKVEDGYWKVSNYKTMGGKDAQLFLIDLLAKYKEM